MLKKYVIKQYTQSNMKLTCTQTTYKIGFTQKTRDFLKKKLKYVYFYPWFIKDRMKKVEKNHVKEMNFFLKKYPSI